MNNRGVIGVLALFLMFALVVFGLAVSLVVRGQYLNVVNKAEEIKSLYLAEAGVERAIWKLKEDPSLQKTGVLFQNVLLGEGSYTVEITNVEVVGNDTSITFVSWGATGSKLRKKIEVKVLFRNISGGESVFYDYALFWGNTNGGGSLSLNNSVDINRLGSASGDVFANGDIYINQMARVVPGLVYATGNIGGNGIYTPGGVPNPVPQFPVLDTSYYDQLLAVASTYPAGDWTLSGGAYNLAGSTLYVNGKVTIKNTGQLIGPGRVVATEEVELKNATVTQGVEIIAGGELEAKNAAQISEGSLLYSSSEIDLSNSVFVRGMVISPGDIEIQNSVQILGIVYAGGELGLRNSVQIVGSVVADEYKNGRIINAVHIVHSYQYFPSSFPQFQGASQEIRAEVTSYKEYPLSSL